MLIKKGTILTINHTRKGIFQGIATEDFDTDTAEWYPVTTQTPIRGMSKDWEAGEKIPCRASLCQVTLLNEN